MEEAARLCDRIAIIDNGHIIASGTEEALIRDTIGSGQVVTIETTAPISARIKEALQKFGASVDGEKAHVTVRDPARQIRELLEIFHADGAEIRDLTLKGATLEQVFLNLTGRELRE